MCHVSFLLFSLLADVFSNISLTMSVIHEIDKGAPDVQITIEPSHQS